MYGAFGRVLISCLQKRICGLIEIKNSWIQISARIELGAFVPVTKSRRFDVPDELHLQRCACASKQSRYWR